MNVAGLPLSDDSFLAWKGSIPERRLSAVISYRDSNKHWHSHNNFHFTSENRLLIVDISIGHRKHSFIFNFNEIEKACSSNGQWGVVNKTLPNVGAIELAARRLPADKNYVLRKKEEVIRGLNKQVESIQTFNEDPQLPAYATMTANLRGIGGVSLLHAAIELVDTLPLVERLLALGADPQAASAIGTPREIAQKLYQRSLDKLEDAKSTGKPASVIDAHSERCAKAKQVLDILLTTKTPGPGDDSSARHVSFANS
jgi:hypothetical protein